MSGSGRFGDFRGLTKLPPGAPFVRATPDVMLLALWFRAQAWKMATKSFAATAAAVLMAGGVIRTAGELCQRPGGSAI